MCTTDNYGICLWPTKSITVFCGISTYFLTVFAFQGAQLQRVGGKQFQQNVNDLLSKTKYLDTAAG